MARVPETRYTFDLDLEDINPENEWDVYHLRLHRRTASGHMYLRFMKERIKYEYLQNIIKSMVQHLTKTAESTIQRILSLMEGFSVRLVENSRKVL